MRKDACPAEGALPDASCSVIINREMIPSFKENDYYGGVNKALVVILPVLANEYSIEEYEKGEEDKMIVGLAMLVAGMALVFIVIALVSKDQDNKNDRNGNSGTFGGGNGADVAAAILLGSLLGGRSSGRSGGSFGGGSFGGGGFGGFGGGSFGGGGAGGSW